MKKALLSLSLSTVFALTACEKISQNPTASSQQAVGSSQKIADSVPALRPKVVTLFEKKTEIKYPPQPDEEFPREQGNLSISNVIVETGIDWLDQLLWRENLSAINANAVGNAPINKAQIEQNLAQIAQNQEQALKLDRGLGYSFDLKMAYQGQRENLATFSQLTYLYTGGAHGIYNTQYINVDVDKRKIIGLNDLVSEAKKSALTDRLWEVYQARNNGNEPFTAKADFSVSDSFYFSPEGIHFVYPPYALGAYTEGEITLTLNWWVAQELINPDYLRKMEMVE
ncbi:hypothetical protein B0187_02855 [Haemophilus paracuniculus]|uniref:DUF3298 domain-containing protein n=1 Tax=Haemophilus paracuniculus TaxID=734 RepID=A0A1T0AT98_9PAST|nr:RsiV family protein [Haemophilus paracuniculus]OOR99764.1 hypothetical protein B0187_02855 [Haemophilus paracuniculus]